LFVFGIPSSFVGLLVCFLPSSFVLSPF
jgi:hypothetical protein